MEHQLALSELVKKLIARIEEQARVARRTNNRPLYEKLMDVADYIDELWSSDDSKSWKAVDWELLQSQNLLTAADQQLVDFLANNKRDTKTIKSISSLDGDLVEIYSLFKPRIERNEYDDVIRDLTNLISTSPEVQPYQDLLTLVREEQTKKREEKIRLAQQTLDCSSAVKLYKEAIQIDTNSAKFYQGEISRLQKLQLQNQQDAKVRWLTRNINEKKLQLLQAKDWLEEIDQLLNSPLWTAQYIELEKLRLILINRIEDIENITVSIGTMEALKEYDLAIEQLMELIRNGITDFTEFKAKRVDADGYPRFDYMPIGQKLRQLQMLRAESRKNAAQKWANRAEVSVNRGYPDHAISLLERALSPDLSSAIPSQLNVGIGDITEDLLHGISGFRTQLKDRLAQIREEKSKHDMVVEIVLKAHKTESVGEAIKILREAQTIYPSYPNLDYILLQRENELIKSTISEALRYIESIKSSISLNEFSNALAFWGKGTDIFLHLKTTPVSYLENLVKDKITQISILQSNEEEPEIQYLNRQSLTDIKLQTDELLQWILDRKMLESLRKEFKDLPDFIVESQRKYHREQEYIDLIKLGDFLSNHFNQNELDDLCFRLKIDYEDIDGATLQTKVRELVLYSKRHGLIHELVEILVHLRPRNFNLE